MHCCTSTMYETHTLDSQVSNRMPPGGGGGGARKCTAREFGINEESQIVMFGRLAGNFKVEDNFKNMIQRISWVYIY